MRILHVCSSRAWGGMEMQVVLIAAQLEDRGHEVTVLCYPGSPIFRASRIKGLQCKAIALDSYVQPMRTLQLTRYLRGRTYDIQHCHYTKDLWHLIPALELAGGGCVLLSKGIGPGKRKIDPFHRWLYAHVKGLIAKSSYLHRRIIEAYPIDPKRVVVLNNGVDLKIFDPDVEMSQKIREEFSIRESNLLIGIVGRISPAKGHMEFLKAAEHVNKEVPHCTFLIIGGSSQDEIWYEEEVRNKASQFGLEDAVVFTGHRDDIPAVLSALDLFVLTSYVEAFPNVLIEAMAMKKACVATRAGGVLDVIDDGINGLLVPPRDVDALSETLMLLLRDEGKRKALGQEARRKVEEKFDLHHMIDRLEKLYCRILNEDRLDGVGRDSYVH